MRRRNASAKKAGDPWAGGKTFGLRTPSRAGWTRVGFQNNICLLLRYASNVLGNSLLLRKKLQENSKKRLNIWKRQTQLMWRLWGKRPKPEREPVKPCGGCGVCREALQTRVGSLWRRVRKRLKQGWGNPQLGILRKSTAFRLLQVRDCPSSSNPKETLCVCRYVTLQHLISPRKGLANKICVSAAGTDANAAARLQAEVGGGFLP